MTIKLLVRQGGAAAEQPDLANLDADPREGVPIFDGDASLVEMAQRWEQGTAGRGRFTYVDVHGTAPYRFRPHVEVKLIEDESGDDVILGWGRIEGGNDTGRRTPTGIGGDEVQHNSVQVMDCNIDLRGLPFRNGWSRPAETSWQRLQALEAAKLNGSSSTETLRRATTDIRVENFANGHLVDASDPVDLDAVDYPPGTQVADVLADILEQWGKGWGVTIHHDGGSHKCLLVQDMDDLSTFTSPLRISDQLDDWDPLDPDAPTLEPIWKRSNGKTSDNSETISGLISIWGGTTDEPRHLYVETGEAPEDWETWVDVYNDDLAKNGTQAERRANTVLNDRKRAYVTDQPSILLLPEQVTLITAGQAIEVKSVVLNQGPDKHEWVWKRIVEIIWEPSPDGRWWAHLSLERPRNTRPRAGGGQPGSTSPKPAPEHVPDPGDTLEKFFNANDAGGDDILWDGILANQGGGTPGHGAAGTGYYYFKSSAPDRRQESWAASAGDQYRIEGYVNTASAGQLTFGFFSAAAGTDDPTDTTLLGTNHVISPAQPNSGNTWVFFTAGPFEAPAGTNSAALGRTAGVSFDEVSIFLVGDPASNDPDAIDYDGYPHSSPFYLPSDYVEARLDELESEIPHLIDDLDDVDTSTAAPTDGQALMWNDVTEQWEPQDVLADSGQFYTTRLGGQNVIKVIPAPGASETLDLVEANEFYVTLDDDTEITLAGATNGVGCTWAVRLLGGSGGPYTPSWTNAIDWVGGSPPGALAEDDFLWIIFQSRDGGTSIDGDFGSAATGGGSALDVQEDTASIVAAASALDFVGADFDVTDEGSDVAGVGIAAPSSITPTQLAANTDNWNPTGLASTDVIRASTDASRNLTGIAAPSVARAIVLENIGTNNLVLVHNATSTAANRFFLPSDVNLTLPKDSAVLLVYDTSSTRWRVVGGVGTAGSVAASDVTFTPTAPMVETNVQDAIDELLSLIVLPLTATVGGEGVLVFDENDSLIGVEAY